jgi:hypothetical protein
MQESIRFAVNPAMTSNQVPQWLTIKDQEILLIDYGELSKNENVRETVKLNYYIKG